MIFEPEFETLPTGRLRALQLERLRALVARVKDRVPLYRERLAGFQAGDGPRVRQGTVKGTARRTVAWPGLTGALSDAVTV